MASVTWLYKSMVVVTVECPTAPAPLCGARHSNPERTPVLADDLVNTAKALRSCVYATIEESTKDTLPGDRSHTGFTGR